MPKKTRKETAPSRPAEFHTASFATLKGLQINQPEELPRGKHLPEPKSRQLDLKSDTEDLFLRAMAGVRPIVAPNVKKQAKSQARVTRPTARETLKPSPLRDELVARKAFMLEVEKLKLDVRFEDRIPDDPSPRPLSGNRLKLLKRGVIRLDRQLDLHGLTREEAIHSLSGFIRSASRAGEKGVLVITGKGNRSAEGPVLQQAVAAWLKDQGRDMVLEYAPAPQEMGGSGAFVVFLRPLDK